MSKEEIRMTKRQEDFLMEGLHSLRRSQYDFKRRDDTPKEKAIRKEAEQWNDKVSIIDKDIERERKVRQNEWDRKLAKLRKLILFGDPQKAIAELEALQEQYRRMDK